MNKLFLVGGAKGVGKTVLTSIVSLDCKIERVETGKIVFDYISKKPNMDLNDYIAQQLVTWERDVLVDTHFAAYPHKEGLDTSFKRGLDSKHLSELVKKFDINLCLINLSQDELLKRRLRDAKERITAKELVAEELKYNEYACELYSTEVGKKPFVLYNWDIENTRKELTSWIQSILSLLQ